MSHRRPLTATASALLTTLIAASAFAQPGPPPAMPGSAPPPPPAPPGTVIIVAPEAPPAWPAAPPTMVPAALPAPQTDDWRNVSHINGQVVKVGERGDYLYDNGKHTNVSSNPIGWMFGFYGLSISHAVHPNVAIRGDVNIYRVDGSDGHEVGVSAPIYFRRAFQGPFLEPGVVSRGFEHSGRETVGPEMMFGWHWSFDSGLNVAMALGALRDLNSSSRSIDAEPTGYFRVGYAF